MYVFSIEHDEAQSKRKMLARIKIIKNINNNNIEWWKKKKKRSTQQLDFDLNVIDRCRLHVYRLWGLVPCLNIFTVWWALVLHAACVRMIRAIFYTFFVSIDALNDIRSHSHAEPNWMRWCRVNSDFILVSSVQWFYTAQHICIKLDSRRYYILTENPC